MFDGDCFSTSLVVNSIASHKEDITSDLLSRFVIMQYFDWMSCLEKRTNSAKHRRVRSQATFIGDQIDNSESRSNDCND